MRVGIFAQPAFQSQQTGIGGYTTGLINALLALDVDDLFYLYYRQTEESRVVASRFDDPRVRLRGIRFPDIDKRPRWWWDLYLPMRLKLDRLDVFHSPTHFVARSRIPSVVTIHDLAYYYMRVRGEGLDRYLRSWTDRSMNLATKVIAVSESTARDCRQQGIKDEKIATIYQGFTDPFSGQASDEVLDFPSAERLKQRGYLLFVGTIQPRKNLVYLVNEYAKVAADLKWDLVIAGAPGDSIEQVQAAIRNHELTDRVFLPGFISDSQRRSLYRHASAFVYPSRYEGFGLVVLEAMACGLPVIASNNSSLPEAVGDAGILVDASSEGHLAAAIKELHDDPIERDQLIAKGYNHIKRFTWRDCATQTYKVYESIAQGSSNTSPLQTSSAID